MASELHALIVAGGSGTRLWPISRASRPKQLLNLGSGTHSLVQDTFARLARTVSPDRIKTVTSRDYADMVLVQLRMLAEDYPESNVLAEPIGRDSAAAVLWGALQLYHEDREAVMAVVWSDQMIRNEIAFDEALKLAHKTVQHEGLVAIGVKPTRPATTLGYIRYGKEVQPGVYEVERFIEKPDLTRAQRLLAEGSCVWNAGNFVFKVRTLLEEFQRLAPNMMAHFREASTDLAANDWKNQELIDTIYPRLPKEAIDYLVLERTDRLRLISADLDWSDLGAWDEMYYQMRKDTNGNAVEGNVVTLDTQNTYIRGGRRLIATVGVDDLVVVDTEDAVLICNMRSVQNVKRLVDLLKDHKIAQAEKFEEDIRPWGSYAVLKEGAGYKIKVLEVKPHQRLSLQLHNHRSEHWMVVEGRAQLTCEDIVAEYSANEYFYVPQGAKHRIANISDEICRIIEIQCGDYLEEDDIVRFEDVYGRT